METNSPVIGEPAWDSPQTRAMTQRAYIDWHSNEAVWLWYDRLAVSLGLPYLIPCAGNVSLLIFNYLVIRGSLYIMYTFYIT